MILILSEDRDASTAEVMEWIIYKNRQVIRINKEDFLSGMTLQLASDGQELHLTYQGQPIRFSEIDSFWYRRGNFALEIGTYLKPNPSPETPDEAITASLLDNLNYEWNSLRTHLHFLFNKKHGLGNTLYANINKLNTLYSARDAGLDIPDTIVTTEKKTLEHFARKHKEPITKAIQDLDVIKTTDETPGFCPYTEEIREEHIAEMSESFFPSLFQEQLDKAYELRIFYLAGTCYPMAIFSQLDDQTSLDFRHYNMDKPNRRVPFNLPEEIASKIDTLMKSLKLDTGSVDMVVTKDERFVFLEINPVGQFGMTSIPCNYYLEEKIADYLAYT